MPELPEVETIRRQLEHELLGARLTSVHLFKTGREKPPGKFFIKRLEGKKLERLERRAKLLIWYWNDKETLLTHLKMTGKLLLVSASYLPTKHDRALFTWRRPDGKKRYLIWSDLRQFGYMRCQTKEETRNTLDKYGLEPLEQTAAALAKRLQGIETRRLKTVLLDQAVIAGIGNIYADEICFRARLHPAERLKRLTATDRLRLARAIHYVLRKSLAQRGTSSSDYLDAEGKKGNFTSFLRVYGRKGQSCFVCNTPISRLLINGRGTHFCPNCQRLR